MWNFTKLTIVLSTALVLCLTYSLNSSAQCVVTDTTPDGGEVVFCSSTDTNGVETTEQADEVTVERGSDLSVPGNAPVINTLNGNDKVYINGGSITADSTLSEADCVFMGEGDNEFHMKSGFLNCKHGIRVDDFPSDTVLKAVIDGGTIRAVGGNDEAISGSVNNDEIIISGGDFTADDGVIQTGPGEDMIIITGGRFKQIDTSDQTISSGSDNDFISVRNALVDGEMADTRLALDAGGGDDIVRLGTGAQILGKILGSNSFDAPEDFDTLVFEMAVPEKFIDSICANVLSQNPAEGQININGQLYEWEFFDLMLCELVPNDPRPIPTLSQWGFIAMAGVLGIIGLIVVRRRAATL